MPVGLILAFVAVIAVALYARFRARNRPGEPPKSVSWLVGTAAAIWLGLVALGMAIFIVGHLLWEDPSLRGSEGWAVTYAAVRLEALDAEVSWGSVHDEVKARTSRSEFIDCVYEGTGRTGPDIPDSVADELERSLFGVAGYGGELPDDNVLVRGDVTYSVAERRDGGAITSFDVRVEGPDGVSVTTVQVASDPEDPHDPGGGPMVTGGDRYAAVGSIPEDPCLVGSAEVVERLRATGTIFLGQDRQNSDLVEHRVLALVWDGEPGEAEPLGGAFWWTDDEGRGGDGFHLPDYSGTEVTPDDGSDDEEPRRPADWLDVAFQTTETLRLEPGLHTIEVWGNPGDLEPSADPLLPAGSAERHCTIELELAAGTHLNVLIEDMPQDGSECPHSIELGLVARW